MARPASDIRERVLRSARDLFLRDGVDGASLREIARAARTSIGMVYYYFPTKDELLLAIVEDVYEAFLRDVTGALDPAIPVEERLRGMYRRVGAMTEDEWAAVRLVLREALVSTTRLEKVIARFQSGHLPMILRTIADGYQEGRRDPHVPPPVAPAVTVGLGGFAQVVLRRIVAPRVPGALPEGAELASLFVQILLRGIGAPVSRPESP